MKKTFLKSMVATAIVGVTVALGSVVAFAAESWSADSLEVATLTATSVKLSDNFTFSPLFSKDTAKSSVDENSKTFTDGASFTQRVKVGGTTKGDSGVFTFTAPTAGTLTIYAVTGSNSAARTVELYNASGTALETWTSGPIASASTYDYEPFTYTVEAGATYTIGCSAGAVNFYGMSFVSDSDKIADTVAKAASDYYAIDTVKATYIIHAVTADELKYSSLALKTKEVDEDGNAVNAAATTEVYKSIEFADGSVLNASDIGADAIYAVKVTGAAGAAPTASFTWVDAK
jgi:hypothetical protein